MEKRVVLFMVLSAGIMLAYVTLQATFGPPPKPQPVAKKAGDKKNVEDNQGESKKGKSKEATAKPPVETPEVDPVSPAPESADVDATSAERKRVTLGSVDPESPYRMLVTLYSEGASIERIEMASPNFRDLDDHSGYLGHLAPATVSGNKGAEIGVVGAGTPAALAVAEQDAKLIGLQPGDIITQFNQAPVANKLEFDSALLTTKAGDAAKLHVIRDGAKLTFNVVLTRRPLEVIRPEIEGGAGPDPKFKIHPPSGLLTLVGQRHITRLDPIADDPLRNNSWETKVTTEESHQVAEFSYRLNAAQAESLGLAGPVEIIRRYRLAALTAEERADPTAMAYHLDSDVEIKNLTSEKMEVAWRLDGPNGLPIEGWWYTNKIGPSLFGGAGARDVVWRRNGWPRSFRSTNEIYKQAKSEEDKLTESMLGSEDVTPLDYAGVDAQYFSAVWIPDIAKDAKGTPIRSAVTLAVSDVNQIEKVNYKRTNVTFRLTSDLKTLPANGSYKQTMRLFAGPKVPALMARYDIDDIIEYGWFRVVSIPLAHLLHFLKHNIFFNYGLAIIALTVIVRGCMVPFSLKAAKNAKMMQDLQPEMKAIAEKYKNDLPKRSEAQSALFKKYNYNPLSGCLPMFMQLPIFLGLYRALATDIELRQAPLIPGLQWASNLAGPDQLFKWEGYLPEFLAGEASGWLGPYFNILPLVSVAFLLVHQRLFTPPATDEQTKMTQDMMKYMTVFMGVLFFKVPAGLCIYFITSSLWSICERVWLPKTAPKPVSNVTVDASTAATTAKHSANGALDKARQKKLKQKRK